MATFLFDKIIFGPVHSRRLGLSLGINVMQPSSKHCNFDCIYCECGWNSEHPKGSFNTLNSIATRLESKLAEMETEGKLPDVITFAGNGEPTMHPDFSGIIDRTIAIRNRMAPDCKIAVLSNATMIDREPVREALMKIDRNILKFDSALNATVKVMNQPNNQRPVEKTIELLKLFGGKLVIQTMFLRGMYDGKTVDNTTEDEVSAWLDALTQICPSEVMLYSIDRDTPAQGLSKVGKDELQEIAQRVEKLGIKTSVA